MRVTFAIDGGFAVFPGLAKPVTFEVDAADMDRLRQVVEDSDFLDRAEPRASTVRGAADERRHVVTVEDRGRSRTLTIPDTTDDAGLRALIEALDAAARRQRSR